MPTASTTRAEEFREQLTRRAMVADGAMGTMLYSRGVFINRCFDELNIASPDMVMSAFTKARAAEAASKEALRAYCQAHNWRVAFFEGASGSPRTGIIDTIIFRISRENADVLDIRLAQLRGGHAGVSGAEITRRKRANEAAVDWMISAFDGESLHPLPELEA